MYTFPFFLWNVVARVKTQLRRYQRYNNSKQNQTIVKNEYDIRGLIINRDSHKCFLFGKEISLTPIEFSILWYLCEHQGKVVSSEELFEAVWKVDNWDTGASYGADRGSEITFDDTYTIGSIGIGRTLQSGHYMGLYKVKISLYLKEDNFPEVPQGKVGIFVGAHEKWSDELTAAVDNFCEVYNAMVISDPTSNYKGKYRILMPLLCEQAKEEVGGEQLDLMIQIVWSNPQEADSK